MFTTTYYIDVILPVPLQQTFTYSVPSEYSQKVQIGCRVIVPFGNRKLYTALIKRIHQEKPTYDTKDFIAILDNSPTISPLLFPFWEWIADYYICTEGEVMKAALPSGLKLESNTIITLNDEWIEQEKLTPTEEAVYQFIDTQQKVTIQKINTLTKKANAYPLLKSMLNKGAVIIEEKVKNDIRPKTITHVKVNQSLSDHKKIEAAFEKLKRAKKQSELLMLLLQKLEYDTPNPKSSTPKKELLEAGNASESALRSLQNNGFIDLFPIEIDRIAQRSESSTAKQLNKFQQEALNEINRQFKEKNVVLLHGVTASGKTEIYIQLITEQLKAGKQVLYLLPEIALTSQIIGRLSAVFGNKAGIYHSKFNDAERVEIWNKILEFDNTSSNKYQLILGARSALFLPFKKLGLIIVDEEHETSYKQFDPAPRYNARDAAIVLASLHKTKVLLGTATPSFESYFNARTKKYGLVELTQRHHDISMPEIVVADLKDAYKRKLMKSYFTPLLYTEIENALANNEQIILFQNRRGFSPFIQCKSCGWIPTCKNCDVSLTYHKYHNKLQCHYCGYMQDLPSQCPICSSTNVQTKGFGTEKIEDELKILFPEAKIGRLDYDATRSKMGYEKVISKFASGKTQILVGTQMITKGLDFDNVRIVGILNADNLLNFPDFRSFERAYQLMAQVSGRAGRKNSQGKVIIQTSQPDHQVISFVRENDYVGFFNQNIQERKLFKYPPWFRLINLTIKHKNRDRAITAANQLAGELRRTLTPMILGPEFHMISRMQLYYQLVIRIKLNKNQSPIESKKIITTAINKVKHTEQNSGVIFVADVDPR